MVFGGSVIRKAWMVARDNREGSQSLCFTASVVAQIPSKQRKASARSCDTAAGKGSRGIN